MLLPLLTQASLSGTFRALSGRVNNTAGCEGIFGFLTHRTLDLKPYPAAEYDHFKESPVGLRNSFEGLVWCTFSHVTLNTCTNETCKLTLWNPEPDTRNRAGICLGRKSVTLSVGIPLCPYGIAYRRACGSSTFVLF
jgi:hypothetical protein